MHLFHAMASRISTYCSEVVGSLSAAKKSGHGQQMISVVLDSNFVQAGVLCLCMIAASSARAQIGDN